MKWHDSRYWYFITQENMGNTMSLNPRCPINKCDDEPRTKRICVAPTAANCMNAIDLNMGNLYVYRTRRKVKARVPYNVYDSHITKEHWLMSRTRFTLVETLDITDRHQWLDLDCESGQRRDKTAIRSWCNRRDPRLAVITHANQLWKSKRKQHDNQT